MVASFNSRANGSTITKLLKFAFVFKGRVGLRESGSKGVQSCSTSSQVSISGLRKSASHLELEIFSLFGDVLDHILGFKSVSSVPSVNIVLHSLKLLKLLIVIVRARRSVSCVLSEAHDSSCDYRFDRWQWNRAPILTKLRVIFLVTAGRCVSIVVTSSRSLTKTTVSLLIRTWRRWVLGFLFVRIFSILFCIILLFKLIKLV